MSVDAVRAASDQRMLYPNAKFAYLAEDHVCIDQLTASDRYEARALRAVCADPCSAAIVGPIGAGKSSVIAYICAQVPDTHIALRVPVVGIDDPTSTAAVAAIALGSALGAIELENHQRAALQKARADQTAVTLDSGKLGGKLGGGAIPLEVGVEAKSLQTELVTNQLAGDRLSGLDRLIDILLFRGLKPIFVLEDTEAAIGGDASPELVQGFFQGPVAAFVREVDASLLIAVQAHIANQEPFQQIAPGLLLIELPRFAGNDAVAAVSSIIAHRLSRINSHLELGHVFAADGLTALGAAYSSSGSVRHILAAAQSAADHAAEAGAAMIGVAHVQLAIVEWNARTA